MGSWYFMKPTPGSHIPYPRSLWACGVIFRTLSRGTMRNWFSAGRRVGWQRNIPTVSRYSSLWMLISQYPKGTEKARAFKLRTWWYSLHPRDSISQEDTRVAGLKLSGNSLLIQRPPLWAPEVRPRDNYSSAVGRRSLGQRGDATDHHRQLLIMRIIVTCVQVSTSEDLPRVP